MNSFFLTDNFSGDIMVDYPFLGAQYHKDKTVFRVQSEHAAGMELCLFSPDEKEEIRIKMNKDKNMDTARMENMIPRAVCFLTRPNWQLTLTVLKSARPWTSGLLRCLISKIRTTALRLCLNRWWWT